MEQTTDSVLLFVPFDSMLHHHRRLANRFKEVKQFPWVGISPWKSQQLWIQNSSRLAQTCTAKRPFCHCAGLPVPASAGVAQSRCTRTDFCRVLHRAVFKRSTIERFRVSSLFSCIPLLPFSLLAFPLPPKCFETFMLSCRRPKSWGLEWCWVGWALTNT